MNKTALKLTKKQAAESVALILLLILLLLRPQAGYDAAMRGINLWLQVVLPALLPFFIIAELLLRLGAAEAAGRALMPLMRPLFNLPGAASLAVVLGFCSGFPTGAAVSAGLLREGLIDSRQGARLIAFTNNAGPLYISVALATGLLGCPPAALVLAISHYGGNLLLGMILGRLSAFASARQATARGGAKKENRDIYGFAKAATAAAPRATGAVLRESAETAMKNILLIGCYMIFFSVLTALIIPKAWAAGHALIAALLQGCFEMTLGLDSLAEAGLNLWQSVPIAAAILAFGGFSVQAQVLAMVAHTPISPRIYLLCRLPHMAISYAAARALCPLFKLPLAAVSIEAPAQMPGMGSYALLCLVAVGCWALPALRRYLRGKNAA